MPSHCKIAAGTAVVKDLRGLRELLLIKMIKWIAITEGFGGCRIGAVPRSTVESKGRETSCTGVEIMQ